MSLLLVNDNVRVVTTRHWYRPLRQFESCSHSRHNQFKGLSSIGLSFHYFRLGPGPLHCILLKELFPLPPLGGRRGSGRYLLARVVIRPQLSHCSYDSPSLRTASLFLRARLDELSCPRTTRHTALVAPYLRARYAEFVLCVAIVAPLRVWPGSRGSRVSILSLLEIIFARPAGILAHLQIYCTQEICGTAARACHVLEAFAHLSCPCVLTSLHIAIASRSRWCTWLFA